MLIPCGTTGEAVTLTAEEYASVVARVVETAAKRVPVIAGAGSNSTALTVANAKLAAQCGADAILVVGPYYNKPTQEGFYRHFKEVAEAVQLPVILYNVPGRTGSNIAAETQLRIARIPGVAGTKEASANFGQIMQIVAGGVDGFSVLSGDDNLVLPQMAIGIHGVISVAANVVPRDFSEMVHAALAGDFASARRTHYRLLPLMDLLFIESNPIPVKAAMAMMGMIEEVYRLPLVPMGQENRARLQSALRASGLTV